MSDFRFYTYTEIEYNPAEFIFAHRHSHPSNTTDDISHELNVPYVAFEILVAICAIIGNLMVIVVFQRERKLRRRTNYYIVSLAIADFLVGSLGVPFAILASIGLPTNLHACLFTVSLLVVLCTISIFCLVAVSVDRYWAILYPMAYSRNVRTKTAIIIISMCWVAGTVVGFLPLFGWHNDYNQGCLFVKVMDYNYLVFLYFATIITPAVLMLAFYAHIYKVIIKQVRQIVTMNPLCDASRRSSTAQINQPPTPGRPCHGGTMLRVLGAARKRDVKATQNLSIIVLFFMICWIPLYTINCIQAFCPTCQIPSMLTYFCIILSHLNSAVNPVLYAYHLKDFRLALKNLILRLMGIEVELTLDNQHRYSLASQHRLQSMDVNARNLTQTRLYVDSPIWLRQQQHQISLKNSQMIPRCGVVTPCLNNINHTVAAVAAVTTDIERDMWNIVEATSGAELGEVNYIFPDDKDSTAPTPPPRLKRKSQVSMKQPEGSDTPYSYDNCTYTPSLEEDDFEEVFLPSRPKPGTGVDHNVLKQSLIACAMREKLRSDIDDRPVSAPQTPSKESQQPTLGHDTDSNVATPNNSLVISPTHTPPITPMKITQTQLLEVQKHSTLSISNGCLNNSAIFIIDSDTNPIAAGRKVKYKKSPRKSKSLSLQNKTLTRSCSCTSDTSSSSAATATSPNKLQPELKRMVSQHQTMLSPSTEHSSQSSSILGSSNPMLNQNLPASNEERPANQSSSCNNHSNTNNNNNNLNYYTYHYSSRTDFHSDPIYHHAAAQHEVKFSPLKAMSNFIFPPIVKHSSIFQLFHPTTSGSNGSNMPTTEAANDSAAVTIPKNTTTQTTDAVLSSQTAKNLQEFVESTASVNTELIEALSTTKVLPKLQLRTDR